jgi:hypothetical protein
MNATSNTTQYEPVLSRGDLDFFHENGYIVVPNAVPEQNCENLINTIFEFLGVDRHNPDSWYQPPVCPSGNVEIYQQQAMWDNRQSPRVHGAFADVFNDHKLWVSLDRAAMRRRNARTNRASCQAVHALGHGPQQANARFFCGARRLVPQ